MMPAGLPEVDRQLLTSLAPLAERATSIDGFTDLRLRGSDRRLSGFVRLPFDVIAACTVPMAVGARFDVTVSAADFLRWCDDPSVEPARRDASWLSPLPPQRGWRRVEQVPASVVRQLVQSGAVLAPAAASRADQRNLLSATVLTVTDGDASIDVPLGVLSALVRMGFLPPDGAAAIDLGPGWLRVAAAFGSTYQHNAASSLDVLSLSG